MHKELVENGRGDALRFGRVHEGEARGFGNEVHEDLLDGGLPAAAGRLLGQGGAQDDHFLAGVDGFGTDAGRWVHGYFPAFGAEGIADGFEGINRRVEKGHGLSEQVVHPRIDLGSGPSGEVQ